MTTAFDSLQRAQFGTVQFAWESISIRSDYRYTTHEYRKTSGGRLEKHGRTLYTFSFACIFDEALSRITLENGQEGYPNSYPKGLKALRRFFEQGTTQDLVVPTMGTTAAMLTRWQQSAAMPVMSGERVILDFTEDMEDEFQLQDVAAPNVVQNVASAGATLKKLTGSLVPKDNLWDGIQNALDQLLAIRDQAGIAGELIAGKAAALATMCDEVDRTVQALNDPLNFAALEALKELTFAAQRLAIDIRDEAVSPIRTYTTKAMVTIQQLSAILYGTTSKSMDLLQLNSFDDALRIPAGKSIRYYADA